VVPKPIGIISGLLIREMSSKGRSAIIARFTIPPLCWPVPSIAERSHPSGGAECQGNFRQEASGQDVREKIVCERGCQQDKAAQSAEFTEDTQNSWQERRLENKKSYQKKVEPKKHDDHVGGRTMKSVKKERQRLQLLGAWQK
jgi:hypothetical protein